jgi:hypothetical protein
MVPENEIPVEPSTEDPVEETPEAPREEVAATPAPSDETTIKMKVLNKKYFGFLTKIF